MMEKRTAISEALLISFLFVMLLPNVSGYGYYEQDELNNSQTDYNLTLYAGVPYHSIVWVTLPKRLNVTSSEWDLMGFPFDEMKYYQETENASSCSGPWQGGCGNIHDGNWDTQTYANGGTAYYYFNYSKPTITNNGVAGMTLVQKGIPTNIVYNETVPAECFAINPVQFRINSTENGVQGNDGESTLIDCFNGSAWVNMKSTGDAENIFEEAVYWNLSYLPENIKIDTLNDYEIDYINDTIFNSSETIDLNSTSINEYLRNCSSSFFGYCDVPINISSTTRGILKISDMNISGSYISTNFTIQAYDEETLGTIAFNLTITNGTQNYNATNCSNPFTEPIEDLPNGAVTITVTSDGYISRTYFATFSQSAHTEVEAYLLSSGSGIYHSTFVLNGATDVPIEDALVTVQMDMGGYYATVEQHYTDTTGLALNFLDPLTQYHFVVTAEDYVSETYDIYPNPVSPVVYVRLVYTGIDGAEYINYSTLWDSISYQFLPDVYYHNDSFDVTFELSSSDNDITYQGMNVTYLNLTLVCDELVTTQASGTTITCTIPFIEGQYRVEGYFQRANYSQHTFNPLYYWVYNSTASDISKIDMGAISDLGYFIVAILITMIVTAFASRFIGFGAGFLAIGLMAFFVALNPTLAIGGIPAWSIVGLMILAQLSLMVLRAYI